MASPYDAIVKKYGGTAAPDPSTLPKIGGTGVFKNVPVLPEGPMDKLPAKPSSSQKLDPFKAPEVAAPAATGAYAKIVSKYKTAAKQSTFDKSTADANKAIDELENPSLGRQVLDVAKGLPGGVAQIAKTLVTHPVKSGQAVVGGLMDVGPAAVNTASSVGTGILDFLYGKAGPTAAGQKPVNLPLPGQTFQDFVGGSDETKALNAGAQQYGAFELGGAGVRAATGGAATSLIGKVGQEAAGNVAGGQLVLDPGTSLKDRTKAAAFDAAFGAATAVAGHAVGVARGFRGRVKAPELEAGKIDVGAPVVKTDIPETPPAGKLKKAPAPEPSLPDIVYKSKADLGVDPSGEKVLATTQYDNRTGRAIVYYDKSLDTDAALRATVLDHEEGHVLDKRINGGSNLSAELKNPSSGSPNMENVLGPFAKQTGQSVEEAATKLATDIQTLSKGEGSTPGEQFANAYAKYRQDVALAKQEAPTFASFMEHTPVAKEGPIIERSVTQGRINSRVKEGGKTLTAAEARRQAAPPRESTPTKPHRPPPLPLEVRKASVVHQRAHAPIKAHVDRVATKIAREVGGKVEKAPLKSPERIAEKARNDYGGDVSRVKDVARNTITVKTVADAKKALEALKKTGQVVRVKDSLTKAGQSGYRTIIVNLKAAGGKLAEVQITLKALWDAKKTLGDKLYREWRTLDAKTKLTKSQVDRVLELKKQMVDLYDSAFSKASNASGNRLSASARVSREASSPTIRVEREGRSNSTLPSSKTAVRKPSLRTTAKVSSQSKKVSTLSTNESSIPTSIHPKAEVVKSAPPNYKPKPTPGTGRIAGTGLRTGKGVNTKSFNASKINAPDEVQQLFEELGKGNKNFSSQRLSKGNEDIRDLARLTGLTEDELLSAKPGSIANSETTTAARQLVLNKAQGLMNTLKGIDVSSAKPSELKAIRDEFLKLTAMQKAVAGFRTEASNVFRSLGLELMPGENATLAELAGLLKREGLASEDDAAVFAGRVAKATQLTKLEHVREGVLSTWYSAILSGPKTTVRNILSTGSNILTELAVKTANPKQWKEVMPAISGMIRGFKVGAGEFREVMSGAQTPTKFMETGSNVAKPEVFTGKWAKYGQTVELVGRFLNAQDKFLAAGAREMERASLKARGGEVSQAVEDAVVKSYAERTVYHGRPTGKLVGAIRDAAQALRFKAPWTKFFIPFVDTVANVMDRQFDYIPLTGALRLRDSVITEQAERIVKEYELKPVDLPFIKQRIKDQQTGRLVLGSVVSTAAFVLAGAGKVSGVGPTNAAQRAELMRTGWRPNSIKIGDTWIPYTYLGPLAGIFSMAGNVHDKVTYDNAPGKDVTSLLANGLIGWTQTQLDQSFLSGVADIFDVATGNLKPETYLTNFASGLIPIPAAYSQTKDMIFRQQYETHGIVDKLRQKLGLTGDVFGMDALEPKLDVFGQPMSADLIYGVTPSAEQFTKVDRFLTANDIAVSKPAAGQLYAVPGQGKTKRALTDQEYTEYIQTSGEQIYEALEKRIPTLENINADAQKTMVQNTVDDIRTRVRKQILLKAGQK